MEQRFDAVIAKLDAATNAIAAKLDALAAEIRQGGLTAEREAIIATRLEAQADALEALGRDPANPVPPTPAEPPTGEPV